MVKQKSGQIIATDSVAGHVVIPNLAVYNGSKFAVRAIFEGLRQKHHNDGIRTTIVSPGSVATELYNSINNPENKQAEINFEKEVGLKAVDFLGTQKYVDREKIGAIGICGLGSHVLTAASIDVRIKAVATSVMYDMAESMWSGLNNSKTEEERDREKKYLADIRWEDVDNDTHVGGFHELPFDENGQPVRANKLFPDELPAAADPVTTEFFNYYVKRAYHPRAINSAAIWDATSPWGYYNFPLQQRIEKISAPKLIVTGANAHSRYMAEDAYKRLSDPKELVLVPNATHTDLYDQMDKIPFDKFESFFKKNLA